MSSAEDELAQGISGVFSDYMVEVQQRYEDISATQEVMLERLDRLTQSLNTIGKLPHTHLSKADVAMLSNVEAQVHRIRKKSAKVEQRLKRIEERLQTR